MSTIVHGCLVTYKPKPKKVKPQGCQCPSCLNKFKPGRLLFFPRQFWHPYRHYDFIKGYQCSNCGYMVSKQHVDDSN